MKLVDWERAVSMSHLQDTFSVFKAYDVRNFPKTVMVGDMVFKFPAGLKRNGLEYKMVVQIIRIQKGGNNDFIIATPHTPCGFPTYFLRFLRRDLARLKTLIPVIRHIAARFLGCHHVLIGSLSRAVNGGYIHLLIGLIVISCIPQGGIQIHIKIFFIGGFVGIARLAVKKSAIQKPMIYIQIILQRLYKTAPYHR